MSEKRNIVLITLDSLRADHCSFMGYKRNTTPTMDKMARNGLYFENAIAASVPTGPSMFSCFTGEIPLIEALDHNPKTWRKAFNSSRTLASSLQGIGYDTIAVHRHPWASRYFGFNKGFSYFSQLANKRKWGHSRISQIIWHVKKVIKKQDSATPWEKYYNEIIEKAKGAKEPYFLWVILLDTHMPYLPPKEYKKWSGSQFYLLFLEWLLERKNWAYDVEIPQVINAYDDEIFHSDFLIKRLEDELEGDDPIFIIHADHGSGFGEHGFYYHPPMLYEELIRVPLVIYNAGLKGKIEKPVSLLELSPTILELIGVDNEFLPAKSFLNGGRDWVISQVFENGKRKVAVRMKDWKFITGQNEKDELYNLKRDPHEQENLIDEYPDLVKEIKRIVESHVRQKEEKRRLGEKILRLKI